MKIGEIWRNVVLNPYDMKIGEIDHIRNTWHE